MRVLVVEDEKKTASFDRKALQAEGFAVGVCHDGNDALTAASSTPFDMKVKPRRFWFLVGREQAKAWTPNRDADLVHQNRTPTSG